jgi:Fur family iron response transcriptional regulator
MSDRKTQDEQGVARLMERHGIRPTYQRLLVARQLLERQEHLTADQIHERLRDRGIACSRATVYNALNLFVSKGIVREVIVDPGRTYYDSITDPHHHIYNMDTGELTDLDVNAIQLGKAPSLPKGTVLEDMSVVVRVRNSSA